MMRPCLALSLLIFSLNCQSLNAPDVHSAREPSSTAVMERVSIDGIELHYVTRGAGEPVVLIHGSLTDHTYWETANQIGPLAERYRVFAYSRRYNHPNRNQPRPDHSAVVESEDLARLLEHLGTGPVHLVGHSYGAYTALLFAQQHPELVRSLILAEPPIIPWLPHIAGGEGIEEDFTRDVWEPLAAEFRERGDEAGLEFTSRWYFDVPFAEVEPQWQTWFRDNVGEWRALAISSGSFPDVKLDDVRALQMPTLLLSAGKNAGGFNDLIDAQLERLIPHAERVIIPDASHEMFLDFPEVTARVMMDFLARASSKPVAQRDGHDPDPNR